MANWSSIPAAEEKKLQRKARHERSRRIAAERKAAATPVEIPARSDVATDTPVATPPFWGTRIVKGLSLSDYLPFLDERALLWGSGGCGAPAVPMALPTTTSWKPKVAPVCAIGSIA